MNPSNEKHEKTGVEINGLMKSIKSASHGISDPEHKTKMEFSAWLATCTIYDALTQLSQSGGSIQNINAQSILKKYASSLESLEAAREKKPEEKGPLPLRADDPAVQKMVTDAIEQLKLDNKGKEDFVFKSHRSKIQENGEFSASNPDLSQSSDGPPPSEPDPVPGSEGPVDEPPAVDEQPAVDEPSAVNEPSAGQEKPTAGEEEANKEDGETEEELREGSAVGLIRPEDTLSAALLSIGLRMAAKAPKTDGPSPEDNAQGTAEGGRSFLLRKPVLFADMKRRRAAMDVINTSRHIRAVERIVTGRSMEDLTPFEKKKILDSLEKAEKSVKRGLSPKGLEIAMKNGVSEGELKSVIQKMDDAQSLFKNDKQLNEKFFDFLKAIKIAISNFFGKFSGAAPAAPGTAIVPSP